MRYSAASIITIGLAYLASAGDVSISNEATAGKKPNIIFIFTDDQDAQMNSLDYMKGVQSHLIDKGTHYAKHFCTVALCCPSRVNLWTGRAAHNTNVTDLAPPYGGWPVFAKNGLNKDWLPVWLQAAGYNTYYIGKLMNSFAPENYNKPYPKGWTGSDFLCGQGTYNYYDPVYQRNKEPPKNYKGNYTTDLLWHKSQGFLDDARADEEGKPFFMVMAPVAPHGGVGPRNGATAPGPVPAKKYNNLFKDVKVPRGANFNPSKASGTSWLQRLSALTSDQVEFGDEYYRNRLRALQSVDEVVNNTISYLQEHNLLDNTYIIYSSDNGFHISQHRLAPGKNCPYEEDINVPLIIRGPGVPAGQKISNVATTHTDLAPTIMQMAGAKLKDYFDGSPVPIISGNKEKMQNFETAQIEHWGDAGKDSDVVHPVSTNNTTYKALRVISDDYSFYYSVWCTNQRELYNMKTDPAQMKNLYSPWSYKPNESSDSPFPVNRLESRLESLLGVLKGCKAGSCVEPWTKLHTNGAVKNLKDAMDPKYDAFYEKQQPRISFSSCEPGYILSAEGPQEWASHPGSA